MFNNSWNKALEAAGIGVTKNNKLSNEDLFRNLQEVWIKLGRQPRYSEIQKPLSKYSSGTYEQRFGTFNKALEAFVKYINNEEDIRIIEQKEILTENKTIEKKNNQTDFHKTKRSISDRLRFLVMRRDKFKCVKCGRSPATQNGIILHVDHITPWSKGGETVLDNLQTLCSVCNLGKSNLDENE